MALRLDLTGNKYNRLMVLRQSETKSNTGILWECKCDCGKISVVNSLKLRSGKTKSCGCFRDEKISNVNKIHGKANKSRTYKTWKEMRQRCLNENKDNYKWYGGRGITICKEWDNFDVFLKDMGERPADKTLDRIDSDGNYCKENCRWATLAEQAITNRGCFKRRFNK